ncbi:hypothetical protein GILI108418_15495 [Gillisia limnaea]|uniref:Uncharacterized protein n=1 Tax=Gillisia limnaea (strain DSM 15749 / LMG 21470 / R-8282) TaxID=865937 RepID=H2BRQ7_GILLR|nr:hypothetical protein Gilli_0661 [Gillisia limnaea DSM 15749]
MAIYSGVIKNGAKALLYTLPGPLAKAMGDGQNIFYLMHFNCINKLLNSCKYSFN